jgi:hypothetical protein
LVDIGDIPTVRRERGDAMTEDGLVEEAAHEGNAKVVAEV